MTKFIHAPNIHQGGGRALLSDLLKVGNETFSCILDSRMEMPNSHAGHLLKMVAPSLLARLKAEFWLRSQVQADDTVLCFGNLPPLFPNKGKVTVFLQNRYMFGPHNYSGFSLGSRLRLALERCWFRWCMRSSYQIVVQSQTMQQELRQALGFESRVLPFLPAMQTQASDISIDQTFDFVYVSSAEPHKNHRALIQAWVQLAAKGIRPSLALTVDHNSAFTVVAEIEQHKQLHQLAIHNFGTLPPGQVHALYKNSKALIFPSKLESYGLPLLEARQLGLPILASELDYVRDVVQPEQTFDPNSPTSIARAVMRHLAIKTEAVVPVDAAIFLAEIQKRGAA